MSFRNRGSRWTFFKLPLSDVRGSVHINAYLLRHARFLIQFPDAPQLLVRLAQAERTEHFSDRRLRVVGPEDAAVLVLIVAEAGSVSVFLLECRAVVQLRTPGQDGVAEIKLLDQDVRGLADLRRDLPGRFE